MSKNLKNNYLGIIDLPYYEEIDNPLIVDKDKNEAIEYLKKIYNCLDSDIRFVFIPAIDEIAIYINDKYKGYYDQYFILEMDQYNIDN